MATVRSAELEVQALDGTVSVAFRKQGREWYAIALQFDLVGTGKTREAALRELQSIFETYLDAVLETKGRVRFYNPSESVEWEIKDKQHFRVMCIVTADAAARSRTAPCPSLDDIGTLRRIRSRIRSVRFSPLLAG